MMVLQSGPVLLLVPQEKASRLLHPETVLVPVYSLPVPEVPNPRPLVFPRELEQFGAPGEANLAVVAVPLPSIPLTSRPWPRVTETVR